MPSLPLIVLADDLTGAAEIAAIVHNAGLKADVSTESPNGRIRADVLILDTDTRLASPQLAARRMKSLVSRLRRIRHAGIFKKTDSVLRGPILAELQACLAGFGLKRALLVPCNPSLGRIIRDGRYYISGQPINKTAFAHDAHQPSRTAKVLTLLGAEGRDDACCLAPGSRLPAEGIILGEADSPADVGVWEGQLDRHTLPAGGADFFRVWLQNRRAYRVPGREYRLPTGGVLLVNGSSTSPEPVCPFATDLVLVKAGRPTPVRRLMEQLEPSLQATGFAGVVAAGPLVRRKGASESLTRSLVEVASRLFKSGACRHLIVAGGATAGGVLHRLGWTHLEVVHVWGPGVVTLRPANARAFAVTMKPGSYPWPASLRHQFDSAAATDPHAIAARRLDHAG